MSPTTRTRRHVLRRPRTDRLRLELRRAARPTAAVVAAMLVGLASLAYLLTSQRVQWPWQDTRTARIAFDDVKGVQPGRQEIRIAGVPSGKIVDSELVDGRPVVTVRLDEDAGTLYRDARVRLRPATPLNEMFIDVLDRGTRAAGALDEDTALSAERTRSPVDISSVMNTFQPDVRARLTTLINGLGRGLADDGTSLRAAFAELVPFLRATRRLTRVFDERRAATRRLVSSFRRLTGALARRDRELTSLVTSGQAVLGRLAAVDQPLDATLRRLPGLLTGMRSSFDAVERMQATLDPALDAIDPAIRELAPGLRSLGRLGDDARPALRAIRGPVARLQPLSAELPALARELDGGFASLARNAPRLDEITSAVSDCQFALQKFFQWTPSVAKFGDANGALLRGEAVITAATAGGIAKTPTLRRSPSCSDRAR